MGVTVKGVSKVEAGMRVLGKKIKNAAEEGVSKGANWTLEQSHREVPYKTGELFRSGHVEEHNRKLAKRRRVVYDAPYAAAVHQINRNYNNGKKWQYLKDPADREADKFLNDVAAPVEDVL